MKTRQKWSTIRVACLRCKGTGHIKAGTCDRCKGRNTVLLRVVENA